MDGLIKRGGKPLTKLIEVVANGIGKWCEPRYVVRMAHAESKAEHISVLEKAKREALLKNDEDLYNHLSAVEERLLTKESKRHRNIEQVVNRAANVLSSETEVSSETVDPDWITRFFDIVQDISNEQMQDLWGRILAGEVKQPKSFSLRTLETLRNITSYEAELFEKLSSYVFHSGKCYIFNGLLENGYPNLQYGAITRLMEMGLIQSVSDIGLALSHQEDEEYDCTYVYGDYLYLFSIPDSMEGINLPVYSLTITGCEVFKLVSFKPNYEYFHEVLKCITEFNEIKINRVRILSNDTEGIKYDNNAIENLI